MKILVVQDHLRSGGTERQTLLLAHGFAAAGHTVRLLTFRPGGALARETAPLDVSTLQPRDLGLDWFAPGLARAARAFAPDIVLTMGRMANCYGTTLARALPRAAVIGTMRTGKPLPWLFRRSLRTATHVVANSHAARDHLIQNLSLPPYHLTVIHNSLVFPVTTTATTPSAPTREALRAQHGASPTTAVLLNVAMFRPEKNQRALLPIVANLPPSFDWQLWFAGDGPALAATQALTRAHPHSSRIKFLGFHRDPTPLYHAADLAVLTSQRESLSNFLIEAQAHGLPAVAYDAQGVAEAFAPGFSGELIPAAAPDAPARFTATLTRLLADPTRRAAMATASRHHAATHFAPAAQIQAYLDLFTRLRQSA